MSLSEFTTDQQIALAEIALGIAGGIGAIIIFIVGYKRYKKGQDWTKVEFLVEKVRLFHTDKKVQNAMSMLDWEERNVELFPDKKEREDRYVFIDRKVVTRALIYHAEILRLPKGFKHTEVDVVIADTFDRFFVQLESFWIFIEKKLLTIEQIKPYIYYWISILLEVGALPEDFDEITDLDEKKRLEASYLLRQALYIYITQFGFVGTQQLCKSYYEEISPELTPQEVRDRLAALEQPLPEPNTN